MDDHGAKIREVASLSYDELAQRRREMIELRGQGWSLAKIGAKFGITREAVRQQIEKGTTVRRWGAPSTGRRAELERRLARWKGRRPTPAVLERIAALERELETL